MVERVVEPRRVVRDATGFDRALGISQVDKPALVEALVPQTAVETLDEAITHIERELGIHPETLRGSRRVTRARGEVWEAAEGSGTVPVDKRAAIGKQPHP